MSFASNGFHRGVGLAAILLTVAFACDDDGSGGADATTDAVADSTGDGATPDTTPDSEPDAVADTPEPDEGGDGGAPATTVTSPDGLLTLTIPEGAMPAGTEVTISIVDEEDWPAEVAALEPIGGVYDLQPDGLTFVEAATFELTLEAETVTALESEDGLPLLLAYVAGTGVEPEPIEGSTVSYHVDGSATLTGAISHFSRLFQSYILPSSMMGLPAGNESELRVLFNPGGPVHQVGEPWTGSARVRNAAVGSSNGFDVPIAVFWDRAAGPVAAIGEGAGRAEVLVAGGDETYDEAAWVCDAEGAGQVEMGVYVFPVLVVARLPFNVQCVEGPLPPRCQVESVVDDLQPIGSLDDSPENYFVKHFDGCTVLVDRYGTPPDGEEFPDIILLPEDDDGIAPVSVRVTAANGDAPDGRSYNSAMAANGRDGVFVSQATNLIPLTEGATSGLFHFTIDGEGAETTALVDALVVDDADVGFGRPAISGDGQLVATYDFAGSPILNIRDLEGAIVEGIPLTDLSRYVWSADGRWLLFASSDAAVDGDTNGESDIFAWDRDADAIVRLSVADDGSQVEEGRSSNPVVSGDGRFVAFGSTAFDLVDGAPTDGASFFVLLDRDTDEDGIFDEAGAIENTLLPAGREPRSLSADGRFLAVTRSDEEYGQVLVIDLTTGDEAVISQTAAEVAGNGTSGNPHISPSGATIVFETLATNLSDDPDARVYIAPNPLFPE